jgi:hypothetical protein
LPLEFEALPDAVAGNAMASAAWENRGGDWLELFFSPMEEQIGTANIFYVAL